MSIFPPEDSQERSTAIRLLSHSYRRALLACLDYHGEPITLADAAEWVAIEVTGKQLPDISAETVKEIYLTLYHSHIPRLQAYEVIEYSQDQDMIALADPDCLQGYWELLDALQQDQAD